MFSVGDQVLLSTANLRNEERAPKLAPKFIGPFSVSRVVSSVAYELELPATHVSCAPRVPRRASSDRIEMAPPPSPTDSSCPSDPVPMCCLTPASRHGRWSESSASE